MKNFDASQLSHFTGTERLAGDNYLERRVASTGNVTGDVVVVGALSSEISILFVSCGPVVEGGGGGQRIRVAVSCPRTPPVRRQAHRPHVHSPAGRAARGFPFAIKPVASRLLVFNSFGAGFAQAA